MTKKPLIALLASLLVQTPVYAINAKYRQQLERSGCTQLSESQGCDIHKSKAENAKAGFGTTAPVAAETNSSASQTPYAGNWQARNASGDSVASIRIDSKEQVWVNGKKVKAKRSDGALLFQAGKKTYTIQGDRRLKDEDYWLDADAGAKGPIVAE
jgi:hypothetical protein